jgi:hypothetical protein
MERKGMRRSILIAVLILLAAIGVVVSSISDLRPLPFPPEEVWCVLLGRGSQATSSGVVFVALHQDIHNADWVVHETAGDPFSPDSLNAASAIGSDLATGR